MEGISVLIEGDCAPGGAILDPPTPSASEPLKIGGLELEMETLSLENTEVSLQMLELNEADFAPEGAILRPPPTMLERNELGGREQVEGRLSINASVTLRTGELKLEIETLSLRISELNEANFAPEGAILRPLTTLLEQEELAGKVQ
jgi:hypothetical protein